MRSPRKSSGRRPEASTAGRSPIWLLTLAFGSALRLGLALELGESKRERVMALERSYMVGDEE